MGERRLLSPIPGRRHARRQRRPIGVEVLRATRHRAAVNDPFDRMLIAQAMVEGLTIVTRDPRFEPYGVPLLRT